MQTEHTAEEIRDLPEPKRRLSKMKMGSDGVMWALLIASSVTLMATLGGIVALLFFSSLGVVAAVTTVSSSLLVQTMVNGIVVVMWLEIFLEFAVLCEEENQEMDYQP